MKHSNIHSAVPTERHTSDKMESTIISKCLELTKLLKDQNKCFEIKIKLECSHIRLTSEEKQSIKPCKKSPSQLKRDKERKQKFVDIKSKEEAPTTEMNAWKPSATEKAERNLIEGTKKVLNVTNSEKEAGLEKGINDYRNVIVSARPSTIMIIFRNVIVKECNVLAKYVSKKM